MSSPTSEPEDHGSAGSDLPAAALTVAGVARRLGVAAATLRTWDRRYGLGPSAHAAGSHRRYAPEDLARLEIMRHLVLEGASAADAARAALAAPVEGLRRSAAGDGAPTNGPAPSASAVARSENRPGGGQVIAVPGGSPTARGLARAAMGLDGPAVANIVSSYLEREGVIATWDDLVLPVLDGIGNRYEATGRFVEVEHLLSEGVMSAFGEVTRNLSRPQNHQPVLLAAAEEEQHTLPLHAVAAALAERHVATRMLGARVPRKALAAAIRKSGPIAVMLWAQTPGDDRREELDALPSVRPAPVVLVGGAGWAPELPPNIERMNDLTETITRLMGATLV